MVNLNKSEEQELADLVKTGDVSAKKHLYCRYAGYLTGVCSRYVIGAEDVRDILQESFLKIFSSIGSFEYRGLGSLKAWMTRIVVNEALGFLKSACRFDSVPIGVESEQLADEEPDLEDIPLSELHDMIRSLPVGYRTIFNLYVFEEKTHKEIAAALNIKETTSASQFHRAKKLLANKIKKYHEF